MIQKRKNCLGFAVICLLLVSGCNDPVRSKIAGTWEVQKADRLGQRINQNQDGAESRMRIIFESGGGLTTQTSMGEIQREKTGSWKLVSFDDQTNIMELVCDLGSGEVPTSVAYLDDDTIKLIPPNMAGTKTKLKFARKKQ